MEKLADKTGKTNFYRLASHGTAFSTSTFSAPTRKVLSASHSAGNAAR
ncbi:hypothetical protein ACFCX0_24510 [Streptomyces sp. NPDC056352]